MAAARQSCSLCRVTSWPEVVPAAGRQGAKPEDARKAPPPSKSALVGQRGGGSQVGQLRKRTVAFLRQFASPHRVTSNLIGQSPCMALDGLTAGALRRECGFP